MRTTKPLIVPKLNSDTDTSNFNNIPEEDDRNKCTDLRVRWLVLLGRQRTLIAVLCVPLTDGNDKNVPTTDFTAFQGYTFKRGQMKVHVADKLHNNNNNSTPPNGDEEAGASS